VVIKVRREKKERPPPPRWSGTSRGPIGQPRAREGPQVVRHYAV